MDSPEDAHARGGQEAGKDGSRPAIPPTVRVDGEVLEHWPQNLTVHPDALEIFLDSFQGPLNLLLYLIRKQNQDILDIPVADITRQYMEYIEMMKELRLDLASEYLVMAAMLAEIKSRMILFRPASDGDDEEEDPRALLVQRLQEYERFNQASQDMDKLPRVERELYLICAKFEDPEPVKVEFQASLNDLSIAFRNVLERSELNQNFSIGQEGLTVREKMTYILAKTHRRRFLRFEELFDPGEGKAGLVVCFMAILELVRDNMLVVVQNKPFAPIHIHRIAKTDEQ